MIHSWKISLTYKSNLQELGYNVMIQKKKQKNIVINCEQYIWDTFKHIFQKRALRR